MIARTGDMLGSARTHVRACGRGRGGRGGRVVVVSDCQKERLDSKVQSL